MSRLTPSQRKQIISDYRHGIQNEEFRVLEVSPGEYQVRRKKSPFVMEKKAKKPLRQDMEEESEEETPKEKSDRLSNEDLLRKLSTLLDVPEREPTQTPQDFEQEEEAYEEQQEYYNNTANVGGNPYYRRPFRLY